MWWRNFFVRLKLFNHVLALFRAKFIGISAIRYPVFRWELCKGCVWKSVKKFKCVCAFGGFLQLDLASDSRLATRQNATRVKHAGSWRITTARALQDKNWQSGLAVNSRLIPLVRLSRQNALFYRKMTFHISRVTTINTLIPTKCRELPERIFVRETLEKTKIDSSTILNIWFSKFLYSHSLH